MEVNCAFITFMKTHWILHYLQYISLPLLVLVAYQLNFVHISRNACCIFIQGVRGRYFRFHNIYDIYENTLEPPLYTICTNLDGNRIQ